MFYWQHLVSTIKGSNKSAFISNHIYKRWYYRFSSLLFVCHSVWRGSNSTPVSGSRQDCGNKHLLGQENGRKTELVWSQLYSGAARSLFYCLAKNKQTVMVGLAQIRYLISSKISQKHPEIAKGCPEYITSRVKVSSCSYQIIWVVANKFFSVLLKKNVFEFCHHLSFFCVTI